MRHTVELSVTGSETLSMQHNWGSWLKPTSGWHGACARDADERRDVCASMACSGACTSLSFTRRGPCMQHAATCYANARR
jgi:hypothetical protein